jgi:hypothetical protein
MLVTPARARSEGAERTVACALGHLQVEVFARLVFLTHVVIEAYQRLAGIRSGRRVVGSESCAHKFVVERCAAKCVLEERGAAKVGWEEPHEQRR